MIATIQFLIINAGIDLGLGRTITTRFPSLDQYMSLQLKIQTIELRGLNNIFFFRCSSQLIVSQVHIHPQHWSLVSSVKRVIISLLRDREVA